MWNNGRGGEHKGWAACIALTAVEKAVRAGLRQRAAHLTERVAARPGRGHFLPLERRDRLKDVLVIIAARLLGADDAGQDERANVDVRQAVRNHAADVHELVGRLVLGPHGHVAQLLANLADRAGAAPVDAAAAPNVREAAVRARGVPLVGSRLEAPRLDYLLYRYYYLLYGNGRGDGRSAELKTHAGP